MKTYVPDRGDVVWLNFTPQAGHEQAGHRPALVLSPVAYNTKTGLMLCCPITSQVKGYPFEVSLGRAAGVRGVVLADQVRSLDWHARQARKKGKAPKDVVEQTLRLILMLLSGNQRCEDCYARASCRMSGCVQARSFSSAVTSAARWCNAVATISRSAGSSGRPFNSTA